jgi:hypothetical protein
LLTKFTRPPAAIVTDRGDTPFAVIVMVGVDPPGVGVGVGVGLGTGAGVGELGELSPPPHDTAASATVRAANRGARGFRIRKISSR